MSLLHARDQAEVELEEEAYRELVDGWKKKIVAERQRFYKLRRFWAAIQFAFTQLKDD